MVKKELVTELTTGKFHEIMKDEKALVVADFFAEWCMPCVLISPVIESLAEKNKKIKFVKINVDDNPDLAEKYEVTSIPCIVFFKHGKELKRLVGAGSEEAIQERVDELK